MKLKYILLFAVMVNFAFPVFAEESAGVVDVGNKYCPVSGDKVSGQHFVEHDGKRYGLCCKMCADKFLKHPEKFIAKMTELEARPDDAAEYEEGHEHHHHDAHEHPEGHEHSGNS